MGCQETEWGGDMQENGPTCGAGSVQWRMSNMLTVARYCSDTNPRYADMMMPYRHNSDTHCWNLDMKIPSGIYTLKHVENDIVMGRSHKKCTSVPPKALFGKTIGSTPKMPLKIFLYWSDCVDTNCWPQSRQGPNIQELKCLTQSPFIHYITENLNYLT